MSVKGLSINIILLTMWLTPCSAQSQLRAIERIYISTDRTLYLSGESIWLSLFCFDISGENVCFTDVSSVAYVELRNADSFVSGVKLRIEKGRGSGRMQIPTTVPTGNYRLIAYTKQMLNEEELRCFDLIVPIVNTLSTERVPEGVQIQDEYSAPRLHVDTKHIEIKIGGDKNSVSPNELLPVSLVNKSGEAMTLSLSVSGANIQSVDEYSLSDFFAKNEQKPLGIKFQNNLVPEYEGEIVRGRISNIEGTQSESHSVFLSAAGPEVEVYSSPVDTKTGEFAFFTTSIYGKREIVLEFPSADEAVFELFDPFIKPPVKPAPVFFLDKKHEPFLTRRSIEMQVSLRFGIDSLFDKRTIHGDPLISNNKSVVYLLDNYTRFPMMQDIVIEFVSEVRLRRINNLPSFQILLDTRLGKSFSDNPLLVIDGIAIFDHERFLTYDPLKAKSLTIHQNSYRIGNRVFNGIVQLNTYTGKYPGLTLGKNALIVDYQGVQYPCRFTCSSLVASEILPDLRTLLYWDPQIDLAQREVVEVMVRTSSVPGKYEIKLEGVTASGQPFLHRSEFTVL